MPKHAYKTMDCDIHCLEPTDLWVRYIDRRFLAQAPRPQDRESGIPGRLQVLGRSIPARLDMPERQEDYHVRLQLADERFAKLGRVNVPDDGTSPASMLAAMDLEGIDVGVVCRTDAAHVVAHDDMPAPLAAAICAAFNDWLKDFCAAQPKRLLAAAQIAVHDVSLAVAEARRAVSELGAVAVVLPSNPVQGRPWYSPCYDPLWAALESLNTAVVFHGIQLANQEHLGNRYLDNFPLLHGAGHSIELMLALGAMLTGGVFERFPKLRAAFLEGQCGWIPFWLHSLDERWDKFGNRRRFGLKLRPSEYFLRQCYVSTDPDEQYLSEVVEHVGDDNIVFSTDWPHHDSLYPKAVHTFLTRPGLSDSTRRKILWDNCAALYNYDDESK